jgi:hypothetical protein
MIPMNTPGVAEVAVEVAVAVEAEEVEEAVEVEAEVVVKKIGGVIFCIVCDHSFKLKHHKWNLNPKFVAT